MASAQVLPSSAASSRKGHLEAGKKRLEEFRRQKASKKAGSTGQLQSADIDRYHKHTQNSEHVTDGAASCRDGVAVTNSSRSVTAYENKTIISSQITGVGSSNGTFGTSSTWLTGNHTFHGGLEQEAVSDEVSKLDGISGFSQLANGYYDHFRVNSELTHTKSEPTDVITADQHISSDSVCAKPNIDGNINHSSIHYSDEAQSGGNRHSSGTYMHDSDASGGHMSTHPERSESVSAPNPSTLANLSGVQKDSILRVEQPSRSANMDHDSALGINIGGGKIANAISRRLTVVGSVPWHVSEPSSADFSSALRSSSNPNPFPSSGYGAAFGRSRPSFLDSLGVPRGSSLSHMPYGEPEKANPPASFNISKSDSAEIYSSSPDQQMSVEPDTVEQSYSSRISDVIIEEPSLASVSISDVQLLNRGAGDHDTQRDHYTTALKKDEDFGALEQHIEDLTQEKFSLQRALDTSRTLAESLAAENSSLTESYNQQGKVISQLKSDMERLQEEIKAQLLALESVKMEFANARLECNAADERAKILASEVISLEEKALRLRSNELKLEKQLEDLNSEISSYRRKESILERERQDFQSTINALQEEKKLLRSKLRKASADGKVKDTRKASPTRRDASTNTEDLGVEHVNLADGETGVPETMLNNTLQDIRPFLSLPEDGRLNLSDGSGDIPLDQLRMISNINSLTCELALEKEELVRALKIESSNCSKLKELNKDLSQKLEAQTQRLGLMTAQQMANDNVLSKPVDSHIMHDTTEYADEGDEVVERVLGWIMKLFPGGPAKRRTSKLL